MFQFTKEMLIGVLVLLGAVLIIILVLILRKQKQLKKLQAGTAGGKPVTAPEVVPEKPEEEMPAKTARPEKPPTPEISHAEIAAIKESIMKEPAPAPKFAKEAKERPKPEKPKPIEKPKAVSLRPVTGEEESVVEEGMEPEEYAEIVRPLPKASKAPEPEEEPEIEEGLELVDLGEVEAPAGEKKPWESRPKPEGKKPPEAAKAAAKPQPKYGTYTKFTTADIANLPESFYGKTVSVEGSLRLSSRSDVDVWYVLFDDTGSIVVRSSQEIPYEQCRLFAVVRRTRLGQTYMEVQKYERM